MTQAENSDSQSSSSLSSSQPSSDSPTAPTVEISKVDAPKPKAETIKLTVFVAGQKRQGEVTVTPQMTVGQALLAMGISLAALDRVVPDASALAKNGQTVRVDRVSNEIQKRRTPIAAEVRYQPTTKLKAGTTQIVQYPRQGFHEVSERVWKLNGKATKRDFVSKKVAVKPQHKIVALGVYSHLKPGNVRYHKRYAKSLSARGGSPRDRGGKLQTTPDGTYRVAKTLTVKSSAYSAGPAGGSIGNWTATGVRCTLGAVAVDPRIIPLGSRLYIEGYGYGFACDTGGAIKGNRIDLAFNSPRACFAWGRRTVKVHILAP